MSRPRRNPEAAIRLVAFVTPATSELLRSQAAKAGLSVGAFLDRLNQPQPPVVLVPANPRKHSYENKGWGKVCKNCGHVETKGDLNPSCPG